MGIEARFEANQLTLVKQPNFEYQSVTFDLNNTPDIAQTIVVTCFRLWYRLSFNWTSYPKIKETDRLKRYELN